MFCIQVLDRLASIAREQFEQEVQLVVGVEDEVQKLTSNFQAIQAVLDDAEKGQLNEASVRGWFDKLMDTSYDIIDDVLDEWSTAILKLQSEGANIDHSAPALKKILLWKRS